MDTYYIKYRTYFYNVSNCKMKINKIYNMNCIDGFKQLSDNSIDTIITDPPYGLKFMGKKWDYNVPSIEIWKECLRVLKPGGTILCFAGSRTQHRMACNLEDAGWIIKDCIMWLYGTGFPKSLNIGKQVDKIQGNNRETVGERKAHAFAGGATSSNDSLPITEPATSEAKLWNGWKSHGLKPAYEPILVAMKPNDGTYANNALKYGVAGLNIDGSRIETNDITGWGGNPSNAYSGGLNNKQTARPIQGRFPANLILDEEAGKMLDEQSGVRKNTPVGFESVAWKHKGNTSDEKTELRYQNSFNDKGGASRFFYCAKASKAERNRGCEDLDKKNSHPTVKPLKLMEYLCTLTKTPTGGIVLDPFAGSGTTLIAAHNTKRNFIGFEMNKEYYKIAEARIKTILKQSRLK